MQKMNDLLIRWTAAGVGEGSFGRSSSTDKRDLAVFSDKLLMAPAVGCILRALPSARRR